MPSAPTRRTLVSRSVADADVDARTAAGSFQCGHRQRIGFFAGGGCAAPDVDLTAAAAQVSARMGKVMLFAKEIGQVGGQRVDKVLQLFIAALGKQRSR